MSSPREIWEKFFADCDLPLKIRKQYAEIFVKERIQPNMLKDLDKSMLKDLNILTIGDQLAILRYIKETDGVNAPAFKMIQSSSSSKEPVTTSSMNRKGAGDSVLRAKATSSTSSARTPMVSRSITIQKRQTVVPRLTGLRSDEILLERAIQSEPRHLQPQTSYRLQRPEPRRLASTPYNVVQQAQIAARDSIRRSFPTTSRSSIHDRVTYGSNSRSPVVRVINRRRY